MKIALVCCFSSSVAILNSLGSLVLLRSLALSVYYCTIMSSMVIKSSMEPQQRSEIIIDPVSNAMFANVGLTDKQGNQIGDHDMANGPIKPNQPIQLWSAVYKNHTLAADGSLFGFVYSIGPNDMAVQIQRKYGKFSVVIGCFKRPISGGAPLAYNSESFLAKKGLAILMPENLQALDQLMPTLKQEMTILEAKIGVSAQ